MRTLKSNLLCFLMLSLIPISSNATEAIFNMDEILNEKTLKPEIIKDWHSVKGRIQTRQKQITICVGSLWEGAELRIPVRFVVPANSKAKGFWLTGGHQLKHLENSVRPNPIEQELLSRGIGLVYTIVQVPKSYGDEKLGNQMNAQFLKTLNTRYSIQYWGWPAILMRSITAAYSEKEHFEPGKIAISGGSKNGASPSVAVIHDKRITAVFATVSPIWESPLRMCDTEAWEKWKQVPVRNQKHSDHRFLGGTYGPIYNRDAMNAGHNWKDLQNLAKEVAPQVFISQNLGQLKERGVDLLFHPGTHDFVAFDLQWGSSRYPQIPIYLKANTGHGFKKGHPKAEKRQQNLPAFLYAHFLDEVEKPLKSPKIECKKEGNKLLVSVIFAPDQKAETGQLFWMFDRGPDGTSQYITDLFPVENETFMNFDTDANIWRAIIPLAPEAKHIDLFSTHRKTVSTKKEDLATYLSSPYSRLAL